MVDDGTIIDAFGLSQDPDLSDIVEKVEERLKQIHGHSYSLEFGEFEGSTNYSMRTGPGYQQDRFAVELNVADVPENAPSFDRIGIEVSEESEHAYPDNVLTMAYGFRTGGFERELEDAYGGISGNVIWYDPHNFSEWDAVVGN